MARYRWASACPTSRGEAMPQLDPSEPLDVAHLLKRLKAAPGMDRMLRNDLIGALQTLSNLQFTEGIYKNDFVRLNRLDSYARGGLQRWTSTPQGLVLTYASPVGVTGKVRDAIDKLWDNRPKTGGTTPENNE